MIDILHEQLRSANGLQVVILLGLCSLLIRFAIYRDQLSRYALYNGNKPGEFFYSKAKMRFVADAQKLIQDGLNKCGKIYRIVTDNRVTLVLSGEHANHIRNNDHLSFGPITAEEFHAGIPGFEPFKQGSEHDMILEDAVRMNLTQALGLLTQPLSEETTITLKEYWTDSPEWHDIGAKDTILRIVAQLSSRIFLGQELCRSKDWLHVTVDYSVSAIEAANTLRLWPKFLRPYVHWFLPSCRSIRTQLAEARSIINPVLEKRRQEKINRMEKGAEPIKYIDALEWMENAAKGRPYDAAVAQQMLSLAAVHTMSDMITQVIYDIYDKPELLKEMRDEVISVIKAEGWKKTSLYKLRLMDSVLKESQRLKPAAIVSMRREALEDIKLPDGTTMPKGAVLMVSCHQMWDESIYENANRFDPYRFLRMRESNPMNENAAQLVSTTPNHMGFGHGKLACPGRFFAASEMKILMCHILLKYDIRPCDSSTPQVLRHGVNLVADPMAKISIRRREDEIFLD